MADNDFGGTMEASQSDFSSTGTGASSDAGSGESAAAGWAGAALGSVGLAAALAAQPLATISFMGSTAGPAFALAGAGIAATFVGFRAADLNISAMSQSIADFAAPSTPGNLADALATGSGYGGFVSGVGSYTDPAADGAWSDPRNYGAGTGSEGGGG